MSRPTVFERNPTLTRPAGGQAWQESFGPMLVDLRDQIGRLSPQEIAARAGLIWDRPAGEFRLHWLDQLYCITWPELIVRAGGVSEPAGAATQGLLLYYLAMADEAPATGTWIAFRELPDGWLYHQAFQGYSGNRLVRALGNDAAKLVTAAKSLGGTAAELGDYGFHFTVLPRVQLAIVYWLGDDEFAPQAQVLFDRAAGHYLPTDGLAQLGSNLVSRILTKAASP